MKKQLLRAIVIILFILPVSVLAQKNGAHRENMKIQKGKIEALKKEYLTKELSMTETEAKKFWPVYEEFESKVNEQRKKERQINKDFKENFENLSDSELKEKTDDLFSIEIATIQLKKEYLQKYAAILGQKRATKVLHLEREFKKELMKRMRENNSSGNPGKTPPPPPEK